MHWLAEVRITPNSKGQSYNGITRSGAHDEPLSWPERTVWLMEQLIWQKKQGRKRNIKYHELFYILVEWVLFDCVKL